MIVRKFNTVLIILNSLSIADPYSRFILITLLRLPIFSFLCIFQLSYLSIYLYKYLYIYLCTYLLIYPSICLPTDLTLHFPCSSLAYVSLLSYLYITWTTRIWPTIKLPSEHHEVGYCLKLDTRSAISSKIGLFFQLSKIVEFLYTML